MTMPHDGDVDHPWYLDLRPDPVRRGHEADMPAALEALDALDAVVLAVHVDTVPSLSDLIAGWCPIGWTIAVPGAVERHAIERIAAMVGTEYDVTIAPGHPLPPAADAEAPSPVLYRAAPSPGSHVARRV